MKTHGRHGAATTYLLSLAVGTWTWLHPATGFAETMPACAPESGRVSVSPIPVTLRVFYDSAIPEASTRAEVQALQVYWARYGVQIDAPQRFEKLARPVWLAGYAKDLPSRNDRPKVSGEGAEEPTAKDIVAAVVLRNLLEFWAEQAAVPSSDVWLVVVPRLTAPGTFFDGVFRDFHGLGLSPSSTRSAFLHGPGERLFRTLAGRSFPPTLLLVPRSVHRDPFVGAHEMGHLLGLPHQPQPSALMSTTRSPGCRPILQAEELDIALKSAQLHTKAKNQGEVSAEP